MFTFAYTNIEVLLYTQTMYVLNVSQRFKPDWSICQAMTKGPVHA